MKIGKSQQVNNAYLDKRNALSSLLFKSKNSEFLVEEALNILVDIIGDVDLTVVSINANSVKLISTTILNQDNKDLLLNMIDYYLASSTGKISETIKIRQRPDILETKAISLECGSVVKAYLLVDLYEGQYTDITQIQDVYEIFSMIVRLFILERDIGDAYEKDALTQLKTRDALITMLDSVIEADALNARDSFHIGLAHLKNAQALNKGGGDAYIKVDNYLREIAHKLVSANKDRVYRLCGATFAFLMHKNIQDACKQATKILDDLMDISPELEVSVLVGKLKSTGIDTIYNCEKHSSEAESGSVTVYANSTTPEEEMEFNERALAIRTVDYDRINIYEEAKNKPQKNVERMEGEVVDGNGGSDILYKRGAGDNSHITFDFGDIPDDEELDIDMNGEGLSFDDEEDMNGEGLEFNESKKEDIGTRSARFVTGMNSYFSKKKGD